MNIRRPRLRLFSVSTDTRITVFILFSVMLLVLPFWTSFQDLLTRLVMNIGWYRYLQEIVVPYELRVVGTLLTFAGLPLRVGKAYVEWTAQGGENVALYLIWNRVGWQTVVLLFVTFISGLSGKHTLSSKLETFGIGLLGTYLVNIVRIILVILVYFFGGRPLGSIFHDYFSGVITFVWLLFFWWFVYGFVLEERGEESALVEGELMIEKG